jgi:hypothetical protein
MVGPKDKSKDRMKKQNLRMKDSPRQVPQLLRQSLIVRD